uniref:Uncharacterized protein n=1 Tax=Photinus pyralis TaxID=7054 RepID=A0A1Y1M2M1_PHOPY
MKDLKSVSVQAIDSDIALLLPSGVYEIKPMEPKSRLKSVAFFCVALALSGIVGFGYFCPDRVCALSKRDLMISPAAISDGMGKPLSHLNSKNGLSYDEMINDEFAFDMDSHDVMVFLHMQKTEIPIDIEVP